MSIILILIFCAYALLFMAFGLWWLKLKQYNFDKNFTPKTHFSIIVPARNEAKNLKNCVDSILAQQYPKHLFEIIIVNDHSSDNTLSIAQSYNSENIKVINLEDNLISGEIVTAYKKKAIEIAISQCNGSWIVTTDADCSMCELWLHNIAQCVETLHVKMIALPVDIHSKSLFSIFQRLDFITMQGVTGACTFKKIGSMCNGANLAYSKEAFMAVNGFKGVDNIASGDDMFLMEKINKHFNRQTMYLKNVHTIVYTKSENTISGFLNQRIRWASKSKHFSDFSTKFILAIVYSLNLIIFFYFIQAFFSISNLIFFVELLLIKTCIELMLLAPVLNFFSKINQLVYFFLLQPLHILYIVISGFAGLFKEYNWKGRIMR